MNPNQIFSLFMAGKTNIFGANPAPCSPRGHWPPYELHILPCAFATFTIVDIDNSNC